MPALALVLAVVYFLVAFVVRGFIQWYRTGDTGFRVGTEPTGSAAWWAHLGFVIGLLLTGAAPVAELRGWVLPPVDADVLAVLGAVVAVAGIVGTFGAQLAMGASWRVGVDPDESTALVDRWPYTVVRNPIFSMMALTSIGFALMVPSWPATVGALLLVGTVRYQVCAVEEPYLREVHGERYETYTRQVGRFVPGVGLLR